MTLEGVRILRYPLRAATGRPAGLSCGSTGWRCGTPLRLALRVRRAGPVDVVHACNPPDLLFLVALLLRPGGARFVFDHHDLVPELFLSRFAGGGRPLYWVTRLLERLTFALRGRRHLDERELPAGGHRARAAWRRAGWSWSAARPT